MVNFLLPIAVMMGSATAVAEDPIDVEGRWLTHDGDSQIEISDCGDGTPCGVIAWVAPEVKSAETDNNNPDASLRSRPIIGLPLIWGFERKGDRWRAGSIYDPTDGKTYRSNLKLGKDGRLKVKGCVALFCRTLVWTKVETTVEGVSASE